MQCSACKDNTKFTAGLLRSPFQVLFRSIGFHHMLLSWRQVLGVTVPAPHLCHFLAVTSRACDWCCVLVAHPAACGAVTCLIKRHETLTCRTWWESVRNLNLSCFFFFFPATDKSMLICQPQLWNVPTAWTIFCTTLVFFVKAFFYWSELTCAEKPCEFNANCYWALTVSSRAIQKDAVGVDVQCMYFKTCLPVLIFSLILLSEYKQVVN